jgi:hypothetical protein
MEKKRTTNEKRKILARFLELQILLGYEITTWVGKPLGYFDFDKLEEAVSKKEKQYDEYHDGYYDANRDYIPAFR